MEIPQIQKKIKEFYKKYLQSSNENPNTIHIYKEGIGELYFSKKLLDVLTNGKDFEISQIFLSHLNEIIDKGIVKNISENKKEIITSVLSKNLIFNYVLSINKDNRGNWIVNINKINASQDTKGNNPQTLTDNNNITNSANNFNPDVNNNEESPNIYYQGAINPKDDINQRTDKTKYLTDNEVEQLEKDKENFETYVNKLIKGELSPLTQIRVLEKLTSAYNNIPSLKGKKVVITQDVYKKIIDLPNKFKKNHYVDRKRAIKLPQLIADPLYILKSTSKGNEHRFVIVTSSKNNIPAQRLSIFLNPNNNVAVVSAYDEEINISEEKKAGRVLYDKKKELLKTLSASKAVTMNNSNNTITNSANNFNPDVNNQEDSPYIHYQGAISKKTSQKAREVLNALQKIANGSEEETVKDLRNDLEQYGGTNDVTFIFGNNKKGIQHIAQKHGAKTLLKVFDTVIDGNVIRYSDKKNCNYR